MIRKYIEEYSIKEEDQRYVGYDINYRSVAFERFKDKEPCCELCGKTLEKLKDSKSNWLKGFVIHHKDMRSSNDKYYHIDNRPENLLVLCPSCHNSVHSKGKTLSEEHRKKMSKALIGNTRNLGKVLSEGTRRKISEAKKGNTINKEKQWYNDGIRSYMLYQDDKRVKTLRKGRI